MMVWRTQYKSLFQIIIKRNCNFPDLVFYKNSDICSILCPYYEIVNEHVNMKQIWINVLWR